MIVETTCPYCGVGCGVTVELDAQKRFKSIKGSEKHPANFGRLCSKGSALGETLDPKFSPTRTLNPLVDGVTVSKNIAVQTVADKLQHALQNYGPESVAFYLSGQLLTEDYYVANKLAKGFLGVANVDTNSRLCMSSAVAGYKRAFGGDIVPCDYEDLDHAGLIVLIGSNTAWTHPVVYQRIVAAKEKNPRLKIVVIDPRATVTTEIADLHLALKPSSDAFLYQGLLHYLISVNLIDKKYVQDNTEGFNAAAQACDSLDLEFTAQKTELPIDQLEQFFRWFAETEKVVSFYSQGINQSATGTAKCNAIINCHLATGRIGKKGAGPFSITGQPNAMGGREVGGLANMLAAHMEFDEAHLALVEEFWQAPNMVAKQGLKAVDLFDAVYDGKIKFIWIMGTNPAVSLPDAKRVARALSTCETVVVSDVVDTSTTQYANIVLPALPWGEKDGTVTNSERRISRQRRFIPPMGDAEQDWWWLSKVADVLGFGDSFNYENAADIFKEHASLSCFKNTGDTERAFKLEDFKDLTTDQYQQLEPVQWQVRDSQHTGGVFADGRFFTQSQKAQFIVDELKLAPATDADLLLMTGRYRDQWHTMTRTAYAPSLQGHDAEPRFEISMQDAKRRYLSDGQFIKIVSVESEMIMRVRVSDELTEGRCFAPMHWNDRFSTQANINDLASPHVDPVSGQPESKAIAVDIQALSIKSSGLVLSNNRLPELVEFDYFAQMPLGQRWISWFASEATIDNNIFKNWVQANGDSLELTQTLDITAFKNPAKQQDVSLYYKGERLFAAGIVAPQGNFLPSSTWLVQEFEKQLASGESRLLSGEKVNAKAGIQSDADNLVCACFSTTSKTIKKALGQADTNLSELSATLGCGSKCGSCLPELKRLDRQAKSRQL